MPSYLYRGGASWSEVSSTDLPASGVTAGTYGDGTNVAQVTVNAEGIVTAASNVAITGGGGGSGLVSLFDSTLAVAAPSLDTGAGGIAAGHGHLEVFIVARTTEAAAISNTSVTFNADTGANYDQQDVNRNDTTQGGNASVARNNVSAIVHGAGGSAGYPSTVRMTIPCYDQTTFFKVGELTSGANDGSAANNWYVGRVFTWRNTAAVTRITVAAASGNLVAGSRLTVYGTH